MYNTKQRALLLDYLKRNSDRHFTVSELSNELCANNGISISAIYRNLEQLVLSETVRKFPSAEGRESLYQYVGANDCKEHIHMKCTSCGKLVHADAGVTEAILRNVMRENGFSVSKQETVLYGVCKSCAEER